MCFILCPCLSVIHCLCTSAPVAFHCQFCCMSVSLVLVLHAHSRSLPHPLSPCLPHSAFSARNRSANNTIPGDLSLSTIAALASCLFPLHSTTLSFHLACTPPTKLKWVEEICWFLPSPKGTYCLMLKAGIRQTCTYFTSQTSHSLVKWGNNKYFKRLL